VEYAYDFDKFAYDSEYDYIVAFSEHPQAWAYVIA
jgi:hypothetical protein